MDKEWEVEATVEIKTSFFRATKEEAEKEAHKLFIRTMPKLIS